jgi:hypothetical protein
VQRRLGEGARGYDQECGRGPAAGAAAVAAAVLLLPLLLLLLLLRVCRVMQSSQCKLPMCCPPATECTWHCTTCCLWRPAAACRQPNALASAVAPAYSEARMKQEKRTPYSRHYALKGRGRKEQLRFETKGDRTELVPTRASVGM